MSRTTTRPPTLAERPKERQGEGTSAFDLKKRTSTMMPTCNLSKIRLFSRALQEVTAHIEASDHGSLEAGPGSLGHWELVRTDGASRPFRRPGRMETSVPTLHKEVSMKKLIVLSILCLAAAAGVAVAADVTVTDPVAEPAQTEADSVAAPAESAQPVEPEDPAASVGEESVVPMVCPLYCQVIYSECLDGCTEFGCRADCKEDYWACCWPYLIVPAT